MSPRAVALAAGAALVPGVAAVVLAAGAPADLPQDLSVYNPLAPAAPPVVRGGITPISDVNRNNASGLADIGEVTTIVTVRGVAQSGVGDLDPYDVANPSTWFYLADGTGGVAIAQRGGVVTQVTAGDSVEVSTFVFTQRLAPLRGTRAVDHGAVFPGTVTVIGSGFPVDAATPVAATEITTNGDAWEGTLVRVDGLTLVDPGEWPAPGAQAFVRVTDGSSEFRALIDDDTDIPANSPPGGSFGLTGFVAQNDAQGGGNGPYVDDHFLYPRSIADFSQGDGSGTASVSPQFVVTGDTGLDLAFTVTGQDVTLETIEIPLPATWTWGTPGDVTLAGAGLGGAAASFRPSGGSFVVEVTGAAVTATDPGTITVGSLTAPAAVETSVFAVATAVSGGTPAVISSVPTVAVVSAAQPGDVVINELYPVTITLSQGIERAEFLELRNVTGAALAVDGWTLQDIGRVPGCDFQARWAFPAGTTIPAGGYAVVCRAAFDALNGAGFLVDFPAFPPGVPLFEMYDPVGSPGSADDPATPNMVLLDPSTANDQIVLLGGANTNVGQCEAESVPDVSFPFLERLILRDVPGTVIDLVEYREPGPCTGVFCDDGLSTPENVYPWGPPKVRHTLGRDAASTDTGSSAADLIPSSMPTPGATNVPGDTVPPELFFNPGQDARSAVVIQVEYDETVDQASALDPANYAVSKGGMAYAVQSIVSSPVRFNDAGAVVATVGRHFFLSVEEMPPGGSGTLTVSGVRDLEIGGFGGNEIDTTVTFSLDAAASSICRIQEFDDNGISPAVGDTVVVAGWVTLGDVPPVPAGEPRPVERLSIWVQEPDGCGVNVFAFLPSDPAEYEAAYGDIRRYGVRLNDFVQCHGVVTEFISSGSGAGAITEIALLEDEGPYDLLGRGLDGPEPLVVTTAGSNREELEGLLVRTEGTVINQNALAAYIDDGSGACQVFQNFSGLDLTPFIVGDRLDVTGIITQFDSSPPYLSNYELVPQNQDAIFEVEGDFSSDGPQVTVQQAVLVPDLGERIRIETVAPQRTKLIAEIWDVVGRKILTIYDGVGLGTVVFEWDGRDMRGDVVPPGTYLCRVRSSSLDGGPVENHTAPIVVGLRLEGGGPR